MNIITQLTLMVMMLLSSCATKMLNPEDYHRKTMKLEVNHNKANGTLSLSRNYKYDFEIKTREKPNYVKVTSCHQERVFEDPGREVEFTYYPNPDIESADLPCLMEITALDDSGMNEWGLVNFKLETETLDAKLYCNGQTLQASGSEICQSRSHLVQGVEFLEPVKVAFSEECDTISTEDNHKFFYETQEGNCFYLFVNKSEEYFRLVTFGYNEILPK